jgi:hypothetical protein
VEYDNQELGKCSLQRSLFGLFHINVLQLQLYCLPGVLQAFIHCLALSYGLRNLDALGAVIIALLDTQVVGTFHCKVIRWKEDKGHISKNRLRKPERFGLFLQEPHEVFF